MKRLFAILAVIVFALAFVACNRGGGESTTPTEEAATTEEPAVEEPAAEEPAAEEGMGEEELGEEDMGEDLAE